MQSMAGPFICRPLVSYNGRDNTAQMDVNSTYGSMSRSTMLLGG